jgi:hypothetical protein
MTAPNPRTRTLTRRLLPAAVAVLFALSGCKTRSGSGGDSAGGKFRDPLVYGPTRIPPQNVPVRERDGVGIRDPLTTPTSRSDSKGGTGYSDGPERFRGTYIPNESSTPAALASRRGDGEELKIADTPDNRVPLRQVGGVEAPENPPADDRSVEPLFAELEKYGVKRADRSLAAEDGRYTFRASMPWNGATRQYTGVGATAGEAVKQVLEQVVADRK